MTSKTNTRVYTSNYSASGIAAYVSDLEAENIRLKNEIEELRSKSVNADKFYNASLTLNTVALLQGVDPRTIKAYVESGDIPIHPDSTDGRTYIRGSVALKLDFNKLRHNR